MQLINNLNWRYATKAFDPTKKVSQENIELLKESIRLSASSFGLQLYKVIIIETKAIKEQLRPASYNQGQITDASHLFVFCSYNNPTDEQVEVHIQNMASAYQNSIDDLKGASDFMKGAVASMPEDIVNEWTAKQTYIAMGNLLSACAELKIDSCPMEGFEAGKYIDILELTGLNPTLVVPVGYRSEDDEAQHAPKVRKQHDQLFTMM